MSGFQTYWRRVIKQNEPGTLAADSERVLTGRQVRRLMEAAFDAGVKEGIRLHAEAMLTGNEDTDDLDETPCVPIDVIRQKVDEYLDALEAIEIRKEQAAKTADEQ